MFHYFTKCFLTAITISLIACSPSQKIALNNNAIPNGTTFRYVQLTTTETLLETEEGETSSTEKSTQQISNTLEEKLPDGSVRWRSSITRFQMESTKDDSITTYDSDHPQPTDDPVKVLIFKQLTTTPFRYVVKPNGEIADLAGMDAMWQVVKDSLEGEKKQVFDMVAKQFGDDYLSEQMKNAWAFYPAKPVKKGKTWKKSYLIKLFNAHSNTTYRLDEILANDAVISSTTVIKGDPDAPGELKMGPAKINYYLNGTGSGKMHIDHATGMVTNGENTVELSGHMEIKVPFLGSQKMPVTIRTKSLMKQL